MSEEKELEKEIDDKIKDINEEISEAKENEADNVEVLDEETASEKDEKDVKIDELTDKLQRNLAEFDNFRKRTLKEKVVRFDDGIREAIEKLLPVFDNFDRALDSCEDKENSLYKGIAMVHKQCAEILLSLDVEEIQSVGEQFDPNKHFAVAHVEDEAKGENEIVEVMQKGYICKDKIIRAAMVKVAN